jgi:hypothetical protein
MMRLKNPIILDILVSPSTSSSSAPSAYSTATAHPGWSRRLQLFRRLPIPVSQKRLGPKLMQRSLVGFIHGGQMQRRPQIIVNSVDVRPVLQ